MTANRPRNATGLHASPIAWALAVMVLCTQSAAAELASWGYFSEAFRSGFVRVDVFESFDADHHWVFKRTKPEGPPAWADSRTCPALTESMNRLGDVEQPIFATPANLDHLRKKGPGAGTPSVVSDPNVFELDYRAFFDKSGAAQANISVIAYDDSPLAAWMHETLKNVDSCWGTKDIK